MSKLLVMLNLRGRESLGNPANKLRPDESLVWLAGNMARAHVHILRVCGRWETELKCTRMRKRELNCDKRGFVRGRASVHDTAEDSCTYKVLHNQTHTLFFLHQMN